MSQARQHSFATLFSSVDRVEIPIIQRDYAQGRRQSNDVLSAFLASLRDTLLGEEERTLDLDFVYGTFEDEADKVLSLLDGQQRLTTLFLLHWYVAMCEDRLEDFKDRWTRNGRSRFTYATRISSTEFFDALAKAVVPPPRGDIRPGTLSASLVDSNWFFLSWRSDPTVRACLSTIDAIAQVFGVTKGLYARLVDEKQPQITFHFLDLERFGLTDDLYIKMNARGKPLTAFENFKAWLVGRVAAEPWASGFDLAMDQKWMDIFWRLALKQKTAPVAKLVDDLYLRFMYVMAFFDVCARVDRMYATPKSTIDWIGKLRSASGYIALRELETHEAFSPEAVQVLGVVLNHFSGTPSREDLTTLERAIGPGTDQDLVRFFALVAWLNSPGAKLNSPERPTAKSRWDRVTSNLIANHRIEEISSDVPAIKGLQALAAHSVDLYSALATSNPLSGFALDQSKEEVRKAALIVEDSTRETMFVEAEAHQYLQGKIGFLLDFATTSDGVFDREAFVRYSMRARAVLDSPIRDSSSHLLERALLSIADYLIERRSSKFSFGKPEGGTFRDRSENWLRVVAQPGFRKLLDRVEGDVSSALSSIIEQSDCSDWRQYVIADPSLIDYCGSERLIHREGSGDIYLMSRTRLSGFHAELRSFALCNLLQRSKIALPGIAYRYLETYDDALPALLLQVGGQDLTMTHWNGAWKCTGPAGEVPIPEGLAEFMREHGFMDPIVNGEPGP